jgi:hypothetical protein
MSPPQVRAHFWIDSLSSPKRIRAGYLYWPRWPGGGGDSPATSREFLFPFWALRLPLVDDKNYPEVRCAIQSRPRTHLANA